MMTQPATSVQLYRLTQRCETRTGNKSRCSDELMMTPRSACLLGGDKGAVHCEPRSAVRSRVQCRPLRGAACHPSDGSSEVGPSVGCAQTRAMARRRSAARRPRRLKPPTSANPMPAHGNAMLTSATSHANGARVAVRPWHAPPPARCPRVPVTFTRAPAGASGPSACHTESPTRTLPRPFWIACSTTSERPMHGRPGAR